MIEYLRQAYGLQRVAIVDTDCHHGDGTQDIYWHDPQTLFISLHQDGRTLYPGSGFPQELGGPNALGATVNIPLPPRTSEEGFMYVLERVVIPILEEFAPDLVVNSAGQDNHFSDPITQMNFSAQGYARLTSRLKADIAVLEGGYAIEGALPYVNLGIILAMAGLDYSRVREPAYDPERLRQHPSVTRSIEQTVEIVLRNWNGRREEQARLQSAKRFHERRRQIYYDTDNLLEQQLETLRTCGDCGGAWRIDSSVKGRQRVLAVHVPRGACAACRNQGQEWFGEARHARIYDQVLLQDRPADRYRVQAAS
jgi:hypothetical protein